MFCRMEMQKNYIFVSIATIKDIVAQSPAFITDTE